MNLEDLANRLALERESDRLQELDESFYDQAASYVKNMEEARQEASDYKELAMIDDEIKNARILVEGIFDRRMSKITQYAAICAAGTKINLDGLTRAEKNVFDALVKALERGREEILMPALEVRSTRNVAKNILGGATTKEQPIESSLSLNKDVGEEVMMVKVLRDVPRFVGVDGRQYQLSGEDVVVLPKANALVLCNKNIAIPLQNQQG
ncbi:hypothetical protein [Methanocella arvoryzae]|uniref:hypothetical protein n=1 Tax=Methanocella arvoryzae TaxID=1175445 RepID=UPI0003222739|nr:hypothetical protein [Methanocella arvoryzae]